jgi:hypothetical protein
MVFHTAATWRERSVNLPGLLREMLKISAFKYEKLPLKRGFHNSLSCRFDL